MTLPTAFRTGSPHDSPTLAAMPAAPNALHAARLSDLATPPQSALYDYVYRIVAVTAGLALMTTFF